MFLFLFYSKALSLMPSAELRLHRWQLLLRVLGFLVCGVRESGVCVSEKGDSVRSVDKRLLK